MLGTRTSSDGIKILATMNPDNPQHKIKTQYLDRLDEVGGRSWHFTLDDNPFMSEKDKNRLKAQYTGLWKLRYIDGLWVMAEGAIYPGFESAKITKAELPDKKLFDAYIVTCDYGSTNPFVYLLVGRCKGIWYVLKEFYYESAKRGQRVNRQHSDELLPFLGGILPASVDVDPSEPAFIAELRNNYPELDRRGVIGHAINTVLPGIQATAQMMYQGRLRLLDSCSHTLEEMAGYVWDSKKTEQGEDAPVKLNDHCMDALRYAVNRIQWGF